MIALGNLLSGLGQVLHMFIWFFLIVTFVRAIVSWVNADPYNPVVRFLTDCTEPLLRPIRRVVPMFGRSIDLSPIVLVALLMFLDTLVAQSLVEYGQVLKFR